jgi:ribonuclease-3
MSNKMSETCHSNDEKILNIDPWNPKNHLLTQDDVYDIYECAGFTNSRKWIKIHDLKLYQTAFVHSSYVKNKLFESIRDNESKVVIVDKPDGVVDLFQEHQDYENQEFLGDRVLDLSVSYYIYRKYPDSSQGFKTVLKTKLVKKNTLAQFAKYLNFPKYLIISKLVEEKQNGRYNNRLLEDCMEAFICAVFLDQNNTAYYSETVKNIGQHRLIGPGWAIANAFVENLIENVIDFEELLIKQENYKEQLMQYFQREFKITPEYISISIEGPPQQRIFTQGVMDKYGNIVGKGIGKKKADAEQEASLEALKYFGVIKI